MDNEVRGEFFVPGPLPGMNEVIAAAKRRWAYAKMKKEWTNDIALIVKAARIPKMDKAYFVFTWYERNKKRDPDNTAAGKKFLLDSLVVAGVLEDDGWGQILGWEDRFKVDRPGVHVQIRGTMR